MNIPFLQPEEIENLAQQFLSDYYGRFGTSLPINSEIYLETRFGVRIIPIDGMDTLGIECGLSADASTVLVDGAAYRGSHKRLRFTFAHEAAHIILHKDFMPSSLPRGVDEALGFLANFNKESHKSLEQQANMFAARFTMPRADVMGRLAARIVDNLDTLRDSQATIKGFAKFIAPQLAGEFAVSLSAMTNRLEKIDYNSIINVDPENALIASCDVKRLQATIEGRIDGQALATYGLSQF